MSNSPELSRQLKKAVRSKNWDLLEEYLVDDVVNQLDSSEKETLAQYFFEQGELHLNSDSSRSVEQAQSAFEKGFKFDSSSEKIWVKFAEAHLKLGFLKTDMDELNQANELFSKADLIYRAHERKMPLNVLWEWGSCLYGMAQVSEEAIDYKCALEKFREAHERGLNQGSFFHDYGTGLSELGMLIGNLDMLEEAATHIEKYILLEGDCFVGWLRLACNYKILYFMTANVGFFEKADQSFVAAARLFPSRSPLENDLDESPEDLWLNWGQLLVFEGKITQDTELLTAGLEKLVQAEPYKPDDPLILTIMGDALTHMALFGERFEHFKEAQAILEHAYSLNPGNIDITCHLGHCLASMGKYLSDSKYVNQAIEKFQKAISQEQKNHYLWHGLAMAYLILGDITDDPAVYEKVARFCAQVIHLGGDLPVYWNDWGVALMKLGELTNEPAPISEAVEKFEGAIECFKQKGTGSPDPEWFYNYGCALDWLGGFENNPQYFERAISILTRLLDQHNDAHHVRYNLALSLYHLGDIIGDVELLERAIEHFENFIKVEAEDDTAISDLGLAFLTLGEILQEDIQNQRSIDCFKQSELCLSRAIALGNTRANYYLACAHSLQEDVDHALHFLERSRIHDVLPPIELLLEDDWIDPIIETEQFQQFLRKLEHPSS